MLVMVRFSEVGLMAACQQAAREAVVDRGAVAAAGKPLKGTGPGPCGAVRAVVVGDAVHRIPSCRPRPSRAGPTGQP